MEKHPLLLAGTEIYRPLCPELKQFRLLTILPGEAPAEVRCLMKTASLDHEIIPKYNTVSYVWGDRNKRSRIIVNGAVLNVPYSTMAVLRRMRFVSDERVVWADAVCINQNDNSERNAQVAMMGRLYQNGHSNLVFLGDDEDQVANNVKEVFDASFQIVSAAVESLDQEEQNDLKFGRLDTGVFHGNELLHDVDVHQFELLYNLPWFQRLWVLQEVALSRRNICHWGTAEFPLSRILLVSIFLDRTTSSWRLNSDATDGISAARAMYIQRSRTIDPELSLWFTLWLMFEEAENFQASEPCDFVFATVQQYQALTKTSITSRWLLPDYNKPKGEVFRDATRYVLTEEYYNADRLLRTIVHRSAQDLYEKQTSWTVPIGQPREHRDGLLLREYRSGWRREEEAEVLLLMISDEKPNIMRLHVAKIGSISSMTQDTPFEYAEANGVAIVRQVAAEVAIMTNSDDTMATAVLTLGSLKGFRNEMQRLEGYSQFLRYLKRHNEVPPDPPRSTEYTEPELHLAWLFDEDFTFPDDPARDAYLASAFMFSSVRHAVNRRYFKTSTGYVGCGPNIMRKSDLLVVAQGASVPYVLRAVGSEYLFLGAAYAYGLMDAEVFDLDIQWEWVDVR